MALESTERIARGTRLLYATMDMTERKEEIGRVGIFPLELLTRSLLLDEREKEGGRMAEMQATP